MPVVAGGRGQKQCQRGTWRNGYGRGMVAAPRRLRKQGALQRGCHMVVRARARVVRRARGVRRGGEGRA